MVTLERVTLCRFALVPWVWTTSQPLWEPWCAGTNLAPTSAERDTRLGPVDRDAVARDARQTRQLVTSARRLGAAAVAPLPSSLPPLPPVEVARDAHETRQLVSSARRLGATAVAPAVAIVAAAVMTGALPLLRGELLEQATPREHA